MQVVAIQRCGDGDEARAERLAAITRVPLIAARVRVSGRGPKVVAATPHRVAAERLSAALAAEGFAPLTLDVAEARSRRARQNPRAFTPAQDGLWGLLPDGTSWNIPFEDVRLIVHAARFERVAVTRKDPAPINPEIYRWDSSRPPLEHVDWKDEGAPFLRLFAPGVPDVVLAQKDLSFEGFGDAMRPSRAGNFELLAELLRARCVHATFDDRLLTPQGQQETLGGVLDPRRFLDVAVILLARAQGARSGPYR